MVKCNSIIDDDDDDDDDVYNQWETIIIVIINYNGLHFTPITNIMYCTMAPVVRKVNNYKIVFRI